MLDLELARIAHLGNSMSEFDGQKIQDSYNSEVLEAVEIGEQQKQKIAKLYPGVDLSEEYAKIDHLVSTFSTRLENHYNKGFAIEASCPSIMIAGGSNFPTQKKDKQNAAREKHSQDYSDIKSIISSIKAVGTSISGLEESAVEKLQVKIANLKEQQTRAKAMNAYYRKKGTVIGFDGVTDEDAAQIDARIKNAHSWEKQPVPQYHLTSINSRIKTAEKRLQELQPQTDLEIRLELKMAFSGETKKYPLTLENIPELQQKLDNFEGQAFISGKVFAGERHTKIEEWVYGKNAPDVRNWYCVDIKKAISCGVSGGTVNKKIIADCWDAFLNGNTRSERLAEELGGAKIIGGGTLLLEEGRLNIYFDGKPEAEVIRKLKTAAFKWSPSRSAWTRQDTTNARFAVKDLVETEKPSILNAIQAARESAQQQGVASEKVKNRTREER